MKQLIDLRKKMSVFECKGYKKKRKGNMVPTQFSQHIAHSPNHHREKTMLDLFRQEPLLRRRYVAIVAGEKKILTVCPLDFDSERFYLIHKFSPVSDRITEGR